MSNIANSFFKVLKSHLYLSFPIILISILNSFIFMFLFETF